MLAANGRYLRKGMCQSRQGNGLKRLLSLGKEFMHMLKASSIEDTVSYFS